MSASAKETDTEPFWLTASPAAVCRPTVTLLTTFRLPWLSVRDSPVLPVKFTTCVPLETIAAARDAAAAWACSAVAGATTIATAAGSTVWPLAVRKVVPASTAEVELLTPVA